MAPAMIGSVGPANLFATASRTLAGGQRQVLAAADRLATDLDPRAVVDEKVGESQIRTGVALVRAADEMTGTLIDTLA